ncbi:MAG: hypothetical protein Q8P32_04090 [Candidatus Komeilibacteria bacterium]|nr:hypothetical protein [Candidatus Komeilibacteria bacterium]
MSLEDVWLNIYEWIYCWWHSVPRNSTLRWKGRKITGHYTKSRY